MIEDFKFLTNNKERFPIPYPPISEAEIIHATQRGRQSYLNGDNLEINPYLTPELIQAFEQGWELEHSYDIIRQARQIANNGL